jgi:chromosome segregation ATPase
MFKLKAQYQESQESLENMHRENKILADEIKDLINQLGNGGKSVHEIQKHLKRVENEKEELQKALENAESILQQQEAKILNNQLEVSNVKAEIERRLSEKEEEFENTRLLLKFTIMLLII